MDDSTHEICAVPFTVLSCKNRYFIEIEKPGKHPLTFSKKFGFEPLTWKEKFKLLIWKSKIKYRQTGENHETNKSKA